MQTRIYVVETKGTDGTRRLVEATSAAQAIRHCTRHVYDAKPASPKDIVAVMGGGVTVEQAFETDQQTTTTN